MEYSGPGSFTSSDDTRHVSGSDLPSSRVLSTDSVYNRSRRQSRSVPSTLPPSNSQLELYSPAYEQTHQHRAASFGALANDFGELAIDPSRENLSVSPVFWAYSFIYSI